MFSYILVVLLSMPGSADVNGQFIGIFQSPETCMEAMTQAKGSEAAMMHENAGRVLSFHCISHAMAKSTKLSM